MLRPWALECRPQKEEPHLSSKRKTPEQRRDIVRRILTSPDGQELLQMMEEEFEPEEMFSPDPLVLAQRVAQRDVVWWLKWMNREK